MKVEEMTNEEIAIKIIKENLYMTIAVSSKEGEPWISNLFYSYDSDYKFYWYSSKESLHSKLIRQNPKVALSIFNSTIIGDDLDGVYIKANAYEISDKIEILKALPIHGAKLLKTGIYNTKAQLKRFVTNYGDFQGISKLRLYKATPVEVWKYNFEETKNDKYYEGRVKVDLFGKENSKK